MTDTVEVTLKPCPFCGGAGETIYVMRAWSVTCDCGAGIDEFDTEAEAIAAWNTRHEATRELRAENERLRRFLTAIREANNLRDRAAIGPLLSQALQGDR